MSNLAERVAALSPQKRMLLEQKLLKAKGLTPRQQIPRQSRERRVFPLSSSQERMWFDHYWYADSPLYTEALVVELRGALDVAALTRSLNEIVRRHEIFRTTFEHIDGHLAQVIREPYVADIPILDQRLQTAAERAAATRRIIAAEARRAFALEELPLFRCTLLRQADDIHTLIYSGHHIIFDGWSVGIFYEEMFRLYSSYSKGQPSPLAEPMNQYADYAVWQRSQLEAGALESALAYWKARLAGFPQVLDLPTDRPRPPTRTVEGERRALELPADLSAALKALAGDRDVTLFMLLLAAFKVLLCRYSGQGQIVVGSPNTNRDHTELETLIGPFINTFVLATDLGGDPSFAEVLDRVRDTTLGAYAHRELPFEKLIAELQPNRDLSHTPLFQVMFDVQKLPTPTPPHGLKAIYREGESGTAKFDLSLMLRETDTTICAIWEYNTGLFAGDTIGRMHGHYRTLLQALVADPRRRLSALPLLTDAERQTLLFDWNQTARETDAAAVLHQLIEAQAAGAPDATAARFAHQSLTYTELMRRANQLAWYLRLRGVGTDQVIGVHCERGLDMLVAVLGIWKAGCAFLPLDALLPGERLKLMIDDAQAAVILTQAALADRLPPTPATVIALDAEWPRIACLRAEAPEVAVDPRHLAYVIYTSGSTGRPKGVQVSHGALTNFLLSMADEPGLCANDLLLAVTTLSFDIAGLELFLPLLVGAQVVLLDRESAYDAPRFIAAIAESGASVIQATPATWRMLIDAGWPGGARLKLLCGGEALPEELAGQLRGRGAALWNLYGPTETTIWSTLCRVNPAPEPVHIGKPLANTQIYLLDRHQQIVPVGVPGELYIGGHGLARGYSHRPDLTAERFVPAPFPTRAGERLYRTGDLARYLPDGNIDCLGRLDHQLKVRGFRIEPAEIQAVLQRQPQIKESVVIAREDERGDNRLIAYLVVEGGPRPAAAALRASLKAELPDYMVPSAFVFLNQLPRTPNGKLDRRALPDPDLGEAPGAAFVPPRNETERAVAAIWAQVLGRERIGVYENFFELGGYSILVSRAVTKIRHDLKTDLPLSKFFELQTVAGLSEWIETHGAAEAVEAVPDCVVPIQSRGDKTPLFFVHPASGSPNCYVDLARFMGDDQPLYGLQSPGLLPGGKAATRMREMVEQYVDAMRRVQPRGPYRLGGWSYGAFVAFEMARLLEAQGEEVALLALLDSFPQDNGRRPLWRTPVYVLTFSASIMKALLGPRMPRSYEDVRLLANWMGVGLPASLTGHGLRFQWRLFKTVTAGLWRSARVFRGNLLAFLHHTPTPFAGRVALLRARGESNEAGPRERETPPGLALLAPAGVEVRFVAGEHMTMLDAAHSQGVAEVLNECLAEADKARSVSAPAALQSRSAAH